MVMDLIKIIKEEVDDFDWIREIQYSLNYLDYNNLIPSEGINGGLLLSRIISEYHEIYKDVDFNNITEEQFNKLFDNLNILQRISLLTYIIDDHTLDLDGTIGDILREEKFHNYLVYMRKINKMDKITSEDDIRNRLGKHIFNI